MRFHRGSCVKSNPAIPRTRGGRPCPRRTVAIPQTPEDEPGVDEHRRRNPSRACSQRSEPPTGLRHRKPDEEADAHGNRRKLSTAFVEETEVNNRHNAAPDTNFAANVIPTLFLSTRIRFTVVVAATRGDRCHRTMGVEMLLSRDPIPAQRYTHPRTRGLEKEPPKQAAQKRKDLSPANCPKKERRE